MQQRLQDAQTTVDGGGLAILLVAPSNDVGWLKRVEGVDYFDRNTRFNPVLLTD